MQCPGANRCSPSVLCKQGCDSLDRIVNGPHDVIGSDFVDATLKRQRICLPLASAADSQGICRREGPSGTSAPPTVTLKLSADQVSDAFLGKVEAAPYELVWNNAAPDNHLLTARAINSQGAAGESSPRFLTVSPAEPGNGSTRMEIKALAKDAKDSVRLTVRGAPGDYIISMSGSLVEWSDIYPITIDYTSLRRRWHFPSKRFPQPNPECVGFGKLTGRSMHRLRRAPPSRMKRLPIQAPMEYVVVHLPLRLGKSCPQKRIPHPIDQSDERRRTVPQDCLR